MADQLFKVLKSTVMRTEVDARQFDCRADRSLTWEGKESFSISLHGVRKGVGMGGQCGTITGSSYAELAATLQAFTTALEQLRQADGQ
jgi:hypothetical protein